jgi:MSHA biogenesis protein MshJ
MRKFLQILALKLDFRSLREKILLFIVAIAVIYFIWDFAFRAPIAKSTQQVTQKYEVEKQALQTVQDKNNKIIQAISDAPTQTLIKKYQKLKNQLSTLNKDIAQYKEKYISAAQVHQLLGLLLEGHPDIKLKQLNPIEKAESEGTYDNLYSLTFHGGYKGLLEYLESVKNIPWDIYWTKLDYTVDKYPTATIDIEFKILVDHTSEET